MDKRTKVLQLDKSFMVAFDGIRVISDNIVIFSKDGISVGTLELEYFKHKLRLSYKLNVESDTMFYKLID